MEQRYKDECERYHDELTQIDHLIQKVGLSKFKFFDGIVPSFLDLMNI